MSPQESCQIADILSDAAFISIVSFIWALVLSVYIARAWPHSARLERKPAMIHLHHLFQLTLVSQVESFSGSSVQTCSPLFCYI